MGEEMRTAGIGCDIMRWGCTLPLIAISAINSQVIMSIADRDTSGFSMPGPSSQHCGD